MSNVFYRLFLDENKERYWVFFEHGRIHTPVLVLDEYAAVQFSKQVLSHSPQDYTDAVDHYFREYMECNHTWLEESKIDGDIVIADHVCKHCGMLGELDDNDPLETVYEVEFECDGCGRLFSLGLHHLACPHCKHDNIPF